LRLWNSQAGYVNHVYSGLDIVFENSSSGCTKYFYANGLHIAENRSGAIEYYHQDHLGSTRLKTNSTGGVVFSSNYIPFGPAYDSEGTEEPDFTSQSFVADVGGGVTGAYAGRIAAKLTKNLLAVEMVEDLVGKATEELIDWDCGYEYGYYEPYNYEYDYLHQYEYRYQYEYYPV